MERRALILEAAAREFERVGYAATTIAAVAREAGVPQGTLHFHFPTKVSLALGVIDEQNVRTFDVVSHVDSSPTVALIAASRGIAGMLLTDPVVSAGIRLSLERGEFGAATAAFYEQWIGGISDLFRLAIAAGELRTDLSAEELGATVVPMFTGVQLVSAVRTGHQDLFPAVAAMWRLVIAGMVAPRHRERLLGVVADLFAAQPADAQARGMGETTVLPADHPEVAARLGAGWRITARSWAAQLDAEHVDRPRLTALVDRVAPIVVRELGPADLGAVLRLDAATLDDYPGSAATQHAALTDASAALSPARRAFGAVTPDGALVGMTFVEVEGDTVETAFTVVAREHRGAGIGQAVKAASVLALREDASVVRFRTGGSADNPAIIAACAALGYRRDEEWVTLGPPTAVRSR